MADASDSKSDAGNSVWVQVPSPALIHLLGSLENSGLRASFMFELMLFWVRPRRDLYCLSIQKCTYILH